MTANKSVINIGGGGSEPKTSTDIFDTKIIKLKEVENGLGLTNRNNVSMMSIWYNTLTEYPLPEKVSTAFSMIDNEVKTFFTSVENIRGEVKRILSMKGGKSWLGKVFNILTQNTALTTGYSGYDFQKYQTLGIDSTTMIKIVPDTNWKIQVINVDGNGVETITSTFDTMVTVYGDGAMVYRMSANKILFIGARANDWSYAFTFDVTSGVVVNKSAMLHINNGDNYYSNFTKINDNLFSYVYGSSALYLFYINPNGSITMKSGNSSYKYGSVNMGNNYFMSSNTNYTLRLHSTNSDGSTTSWGVNVLDIREFRADGSGNRKTSYLIDYTGNIRMSTNTNISTMAVVNNDTTENDYSIELVSVKRNGGTIEIVDRIRVVDDFRVFSTSYTYLRGSIMDLDNGVFSFSHRVGMTGDDRVKILYFTVSATGKITIKKNSHIVKYFESGNSFYNYPYFLTPSVTGRVRVMSKRNEKNISIVDEIPLLPMIKVLDVKVNGVSFSDVDISSIDINSSNIDFEVTVKNETGGSVELDFETDTELTLLMK